MSPETIELSEEEAEELCMNSMNEQLIHVDNGEWEQEGKEQYCWFVYKHQNGSYYKMTISRSGSYHTDWYYSYEYAPVTLYRVMKKEVITTAWV